MISSPDRLWRNIRNAISVISANLERTIDACKHAGNACPKLSGRLRALLLIQIKPIARSLLLHEHRLRNHVALVAEIGEAGSDVIVGAERYIVVQSGEAEMAFAVVDAYQGKAIGAPCCAI
jgi:hypothetical protein